MKETSVAASLGPTPAAGMVARWFCAALTFALVPASRALAVESWNGKLQQHTQSCRQSPCPPCPDDATRFNTLVWQLTQQSLRQLQLTTKTAGDAWVVPLAKSVAHAEESVQQVRSQELTSTRDAVKAEVERETKAVSAMRGALHEALMLGEAAVKNASHAWARSQVEQTIGNVMATNVEQMRADEAEARNLTVEAERLMQVAHIASSNLVAMSMEAEQSLSGINEAQIEQIASAQKEKNALFLEEANQTQQLGVIAKEIAQRAFELASSALNRSRTAEAGASQALNTARTNTMRIQKLKAKVQSAQQMAQSSTNLLTEDSPR